MAELKFVNAQFTVFFSESQRPDSLISDFVKKMGAVFDQAPLTVPLPNEPIFDNTPIVQFNSSNSLHGCNIARKRADYFHYSSDKKTHRSFDDIKNDLKQNSQTFLAFFDSQRISINRIAFVVQFFSDEDKIGGSIAKLLSGAFKDIHSGDERSATIEYISRIKMLNEKFEVNNRSVIAKKNLTFYDNETPIQKDGILITRDFNTIPDKSAEYKDKFSSAEVVIKFINETESMWRMDDIAEMLWPMTNSN